MYFVDVANYELFRIMLISVYLIKRCICKSFDCPLYVDVRTIFRQISTNQETAIVLLLSVTKYSIRVHRKYTCQNIHDFL